MGVVQLLEIDRASLELHCRPTAGLDTYVAAAAAALVHPPAGLEGARQRVLEDRDRCEVTPQERVQLVEVELLNVEWIQAGLLAR